MTYTQLSEAVASLEELIRTGSDFALAETLALPMLDMPITANSHEMQVRILLALSSSLWQRGLAHRGVQYAGLALSISKKYNFQELHGQSLISYGNLQWHLSDFTQAHLYFQQALALYRELGIGVGIAKSLGNCASAQLKLGNFTSAAEYFHQALAYYQEIGDEAGTALHLGNCGQVAMSLSDYAAALGYFQKALEIYQALGHQDGIAANLSGCGIIYYQLAEYDKSLEYYRKALNIYTQFGAQDGIARNLCNCGNTYFALGELPLALEYYRKALDISEVLGRIDGIAINLGNCGNVYDAMGDYSTALEYQLKALALNESLGSTDSIAVNLGNCGAIYANAEFEGYNSAKAAEYLLRAIALCEDIGEKHHRSLFHKELARVYKSDERWQESLLHFERFYILEQTVQSEDARKQARRFEQQLEAAEREKTLEIERATAASEKKILSNILPAGITTRLIDGENPIADHFESVSILFMDIVGFTPIASRIAAPKLVELLNAIFLEADKVIQEFGLEKIKTIGDAYMAAAGAPIVQADHAARAAGAALRLLSVVQHLDMSFLYDGSDSAEAVAPIQVRIGLHCGAAIAGVVGSNKFLYDLWGDTVNTASRMESHGEAGKIHVSDDFKIALLGASHAQWLQEDIHFIPRGEMDIKGKGVMHTYFLEKL